MSVVEEKLDPWLPIERPLKTLIRLHGCAVLAESSMGAHAILYILQSEFPRPILWNQTSDVHRGSTLIA